MNAQPPFKETDATATPSPIAPLVPNKTDIAAHLYATFDPAFVRKHPAAWFEIAFGRPDGRPNAAENFSVFDLQTAVEFVERKSSAGFNLYVGPALRQGARPDGGRSSDNLVATSALAWAEYDGAGDDERINDILKGNKLTPTIVVTTGTVPHVRRHLYFKLDGIVTPEQLRSVNTALMKLLGSDAVQNPGRIMRLAGTVNYPSPKKQERGYVAELVTLRIVSAAPAYKIDALIGLGTPTSGEASNPFTEHGKTTSSSLGFTFSRDDSEIAELLKASQGEGQWHNNMLKAVATMIGRGWPDAAIKMSCAAHCKGGADDSDLAKLIDTGRKKFDKPSVEEPPSDGDSAGSTGESDVDRLNKVHAILPIGGKTRVVTFGEMPDFPGRETVVMTQTLGDFKALQDKYRHQYRDRKGELQSQPMGAHWIGSPQRRQYDGGMAFMPHQDGDVGNRLNLWHGFGVKPIKPDGTSGAAGCKLFLDFMFDVICSGNAEHFDYLLKREATVLQKRVRTEVALGLRTEEEGCGKGFYEKTMGHLLGHHAMQVGNPKHIVGAFNPHLETLLRLTADEALFVGSHEHRNALFGLITEAKLTIEPKGLGIYTADSYLNLSVTSNAAHFLPISGTARRFLIPTVSTMHMQDFAYFNAIQQQLDHGGYEALLYHFLHEVDLAGFNVRLVPQTAGLREQRDQSLAPLESWWCELLETGTLAGADPDEPHRAVSNSYSREIKTDGPFSTQIRYVTQHGLYDQAKFVEPRLRNHTSDHKLGDFLREMGCDNTKKVLRKRGWSFPPLIECRSKWESRYPEWQWRDTEITEWRPEDADDPDYSAKLRLVVNNDQSPAEIARLVASGQTRF
jgi:hypothetical protein